MSKKVTLCIAWTLAVWAASYCLVGFVAADFGWAREVWAWAPMQRVALLFAGASLAIPVVAIVAQPRF